MKVELQTEEKVITLYRTNKDERSSIRDTFWIEIADIVKKTKRTIVIEGDLNGRVEQRVGDIDNLKGRHERNERNNNGKRLLHFSYRITLWV